MGLNHVYKVVWNKTKGCYVVVSELAKRVGRNKVKAAVVQTGTVAAVLAVTALTGSVGQAALNDPGTGNGIVAWGAESKANGNDSVAIGKGPTANGNYSVAIGSSTVAGNINAVAMGNQASATGDNATALGRAAKAERNDTVAVGNEAKASAENATAVGRAAKATQNSAVAVGNAAEATESDAVAIGKEAKATQARSIAIGQTAKVNGGQDTVAIGTNAQVNNHKAIALGRDSRSTEEFSMALGAQSQATATRAIALGTDAKAQSDQAVAIGSEASAVQPRSIAIGKYARVINGQDTVVIGTDTEAQGHGSIIIGKNAKNKNETDGTVVIGRDAFSEGSGNRDRPNTVIGRGAYTAFGENGDYRLNASTAIGFQAGAGVIRESNDNRKLVNNNTNADTNAEVLVKAGYGVDVNAPAETKASLQAGAVHSDLVFYRKNHINEGTAIGVESRAVGDQSIAIGGQVVAGDGVVALGGNDTDALRNNKYQVVTDNAVRNTNVSTIDDYNLAYTESERTVAGQYEKLVGRGMPTAYKSTYGQSGSVVIGIEAHSTTALGTAIGTNSVVRMGAFGATAIGAGSTVQPNAEAAVAIGMGSVANGAYALAAGTASWAELGDIAMGYKAKASGQQGAIAIGQATNAKGDSSVMVGGANISDAAGQATAYDAEKIKADGTRETYTKDVTERINGQNVTRKYTFVTTEKKNGTVADAYKELTGKEMNTASLNYDDPKNRNGHASTSVGVHSLAAGNLASAYGASSRASAIGSLALGTGAIADKQNAVAIGTGSTTDLVGTRQLDASYDKDGKWVSSDSPNAAYTFKWAGGLNTSEGDVVSFGSSGAERQLKNVAAGRIAEDSTDAINGSQVNAVIERFIGDRIKYFSVKSTVEPNKQNDGATGDNAIAIGPNASATKADAVATGNGATATGDRATAYGAGAQATAMDSTAVGTLSEAKAAEAIAIGGKAKSESAASVAIGQNANASTAATQGLAVGQNSSVTVAGGVALGAGSVANTASGATGIGVDGKADGTDRTNTYANLHNDVDHALTSGQGAVSVGGTLNNTPFTRQITGLAAGTNDTDAVNVAQLKSVNLAFKGNAGTGDVRLHDQRLTVESDNTNLLTVTASDKKLTLTPKTTTLTVDSAAGSTTLGKVTVPDATNNGLVTAADVANAINAAHWNVATEASTATGAKHTGDSNKAVHAGETVKFIAGEHVTINQNGRDITISMKDAVTNIMVKDQIQSSFENGDNTTFSINPATGKLRYDVNPTVTYRTVQTGNTVLKDGVVTNLTDHLPADTVASGTKPVLDEINKEGNQAATVNDVLNAGWNLQNNDAPKDFVKPYDTVNFADGVNTNAVVGVSPDGKTSTVRFNVTGLPITYTTETGAPVSKVGDKFYTVSEDGVPVGPTGNRAVGKNASGDVIDAQGNIIPPIDTTKNPLKTSLVNPNVTNTPGTQNTTNTTPTQLGNVANGGVTHNLRDANGTELALANDGNYYDATKVNPDGSPMTGVTTADAKTPVVLANDGKWYPKDKVSDRGELKDPTATPVVPGITAASPTAGLIDFGKSDPNNVATIGDLRNMGWVVSAPTNGYLDQVRNANQVDFIGKNGVVVTGETKNGIRTITVETTEEAIVFKGPDGTSLIRTEKGYVPENSVKIDGNYYPPNTTKDPVTGNIVNNGAPATPVTPVPSKDVVTSMNSNTPKTLNNVKNTLPAVNDGTKTVTNADGTEGPNPGDASNITKAPITAEEAANLANPKTADGQPNPKFQGSNAATVSDVLNAGWNLQTNGTALDFVKPYDTVNFADGGNTTIVSSTDGTTSKIQVNVTGLPVSNTVTDANGNQVPVTKVGNTYFPVKADGTPDIQRDDKGNPTNGYTIANDGNIYPSNQITFTPQADGTTTAAPQATAQPTTLNTNLVNPNVANGDPTKGVNAPTTLGNVNNGANTINPISTTGVPLKKANDGKWYDATKVDDQGNPKVDAANFEGTPAVLANDGRWYEAGKVDEKGTPKADAQPIPNPLKNNIANGGLINFANSNPNNAATVGDLQNMGWIVGAPSNNYADQVRNANQVNFVGAHAVEVTGRTDDNGIRTITIDVNEQKTVEAAHTPVVYTDKDGNKLTKLDNGKFYNAQDAANLGSNVTEVDGVLYPADALKVGDKYYPAGTIFIDGKPYPKGTVKHDDGTITNPKGLDIKELEGVKPVTNAKASMNTTEGSTTNPFPLANVGSNLKQVVDPKDNIPGKVNDVDGETKVGEITNAAPYTAAEAADMAQRYQLNDDGTIKTEKVPVIDPATNSQKLDENGAPVFEDKKLINPKYIGNNAATVSDVLNAGWNLQNNGEARDFVKPYDTVNFVNGANTTAVVTTSEDGSTSKVTFNVTGLPVTYTTEDGKPVSKVGDKFYKVNDKGQPISENGKPAVKTNDDGKLVDEDNNVIEPINPAATPLKTALTNPAPAKDKTSTTSPTALNNVTSNLSNYTEPNVDGKAPAKNALRNLDNKGVSNNTAATVGDLRNMGWIVSSDKKTDDLGKPYSEAVKNANEVKFVGTGAAVVSGKTADDGVRTITVSVDNQVSTNNSVTPVVYTKADGTQVYPTNKKDDQGRPIFNTNPDGSGDPVPNADVVTSVNGPNGTKGESAPTTLKNVKNNIPNVNDGTQEITNPDGTVVAKTPDQANINKAPLTAAKAAELSNPKTADGVANPNYIGNNAATVSDVLNAGWNLQNNGAAKDFVKPFDTVNFRNGGNTTVTVTTDDNLTSHVQVNVTGLPVSNTITDPTTGKQVPVVKVGDTFYPTNPDGTPNIQKDAATGEPTNGYVRADDGKFYPREDVDVTPAADPTKPATVTPKAGKTPTTVNTNLANPNMANTIDNPGNNVNTPSQLGNVANGAKTFAPVAADGTESTDAKPAVKLANDGKWYPADQVEPNGKPKENATPVANPLAPKNADGDVLEKGNDGKWYKAADLTNGKPADNAAEQTPVARPANAEKSGLIDFTNSNPNNAATVGDLQNMGWVVSAQGNNYSDQVRNANEVKFVGEGTATVTGKTDENGVRTITVKVDDQVSTNNAVTPVVYTDKDGNTVYPIKDDKGNVTYHTTPDGKGKDDKVVPNGDVNTSINGPKDEKGNNRPASLGNVKNNIPNVNDGTQEITNPDGTVVAKTPDQANINKAPLTAADAAKLSNPKTADGAANPNYIGNNAATVSDVLNAGWNLQNNGTAKDFVKPFDTVNFVNGGNTTAVVTTNDKGTVSDVTYNVTGLPITYTTADGKPVSKVGDKFYKVNEQGQPITTDGKPAVTTNAEGKPVTKDGTVIEPINTTENPLQSNLVNPNVTNNQTTTPTQLGNVANGANTFAPVDNKVLANDGKWYNATDVAPNGKPKDGVTPVDKPVNVGKEGLVDFENSKPNNAATVGDLQNLGFVVSAKDNGYTDQVRNANKVEFKGTNGVEVTGKTLEDGTREITVGLKAGKVTNDVIVTKEDGTETHAVRGEDGKVYQKDPVTGKATTTEIPVGPKDSVKNDGDSFVNGNAVATAIEKSGWNVGIGSTDKAFSTEAKAFEKVNPNDNVKYVNGANTTVSMAVDAAEDKDGTTVTTTYVKVDVNRDLNIDSVTTGGPAKDKDGNPLKLVDGKYYPENALVQNGKAYPAGTTFIDGKPYPAGAVKDPKTNTVVKDGQPATEVEPLAATPKEQLANGKDGAMTVKDAQGKDGVSVTAKDGKGTLTLNNDGTDKAGKDASTVDISTGKAPADLNDTPKDAVRANDGKWYAPADVTVKTENGKTVVTPVAGKSPIADAPTMDRIQYTGTDGKLRDVATMDDGLRFVGDDGKSIDKPLNSTVQLTGGNRSDTGTTVAKDATTTGNIGVFNTDGKLSVQLAKDLDKLNSANFESKADKAGNPLKKVGDAYYPESAKIIDGKVYPEGTVMIDGKPYPAGTTKNAAGNVVNPKGQPATEATVLTPITENNTQAGPTSKLTGTGLTFNTPTPTDKDGNPLVLVDGKYYKADNLENGKPKAGAKAEPVKPAQTTAFTPDGLVVTPETAKVKDANGNPVYDKDGRETVDPTKIVSFGAPSIVRDEKGNPIVDKNGEPVMKSGISAGGQVIANVAPGVEDTDGVNVSQLKGVSNAVINISNQVNGLGGQMNRLGAQAAAMAGLRHLQYDPLEPTTIMAGIGTYKGEGALALGIAHYKNESTLFHAGASIGSRGDELMANAGVSWKFGARADETAVKDTFRQGPISASYTLQDKVSALEAQNQMQKDEINELKAQLAEVLQYIKKG